MDKITKLPWEIDPEFNESDKSWYIQTTDRKFMSQDSIGMVWSKIDAEYICRAVNSHEGLVEAVEFAIHALEFEGIKNGLTPQLNKAQELLKEALKKAADGEV